MILADTFAVIVDNQMVGIYHHRQSATRRAKQYPRATIQKIDIAFDSNYDTFLITPNQIIR